MESRPVLFCLTILLLFFAWGVAGFIWKARTTSENRQAAAAKLAELEEQKAKLASSIESLKTDQGKERVFREDYGLAKEGEGLIVVVDDKTLPPADVNASKSFFSFLFFWRNWFK